MIAPLLATCRNMQMMLMPDRQEQSKDVSGLYNRATCFEFHQLLVGTLLSFKKVLDGYAQALTIIGAN